MWMKVGKVVPRMLRKLETSYDRLYNSKPWLFSNDSTSEYTDGVATMVGTFNAIKFLYGLQEHLMLSSFYMGYRNI